jgi:DNA recombination protein RmuC
MTEAVIAIIALVAGILLGFWFRGYSAKAEKSLLDQRNREAAEALAAAQAALSRMQAESAARSGFEFVALERQHSVDRLIAELSEVRTAASAQQQEAASVARSQAARISQLEAELENERKNIAEKVVLLEAAKKTLADQFQNLATEILEQKSKTFSEGTEKELGTLLNPLRLQIEDFRKKVEEAQKESLIGRTELSAQLKGLESLNRALSDEAHNLATALRMDTKKQGNWGEVILLDILESSGLQRGVHYTFQQSFLEDSPEGEAVKRRQTDVVVNLPDGRHLVIDSKVSTNAYIDSIRAENEKDRADAVKRHIASLRSHYTELAGRNYQALPGLQSPNFVVMFVPVEPAFLLALQQEENLWLDAYQRGVLLAGPTTVLFVIRIVENLWRQEKQIRSVEKVMKRGAELYDKFVGFVTNLELVGEALKSARQAYDEASKQLASGPGNLIRQTEMLVALGVQPKKRIPKRLIDEAGADELSLALSAQAADVDVTE